MAGRLWRFGTAIYVWWLTAFRQTKANDFEGEGGPADKVKAAEADRPGDQDVTGNVRS